MSYKNLNWNDIRPINNSLNDGFEEFVCQLAKQEIIPESQYFTRKGKPDAGVECFWTLTSGNEIAWQAKFFLSSLDEAQWRQIDDSVSTALDKHPKLIKLFIAIPIDPPDARIPKRKTMLDKWNDHVTKWEKQAISLGRSIKFEAWWSSDLITRLQKPNNAGFLYFWFNKEEFTDEWFERQNKLAIADLGPRYTPELNLELDISKIFDGLSRNSYFESCIEHLQNDLCRSIYKLIDKLSAEKQEYELVSLEAPIKNIEAIFHKYNPMELDTFPVSECQSQLEIIKEQIGYIMDLIDPNYRNYSIREQLRKCFREINAGIEFITSPVMALANNPYLLLSGEAGCGKSHLLGDVVAKRIEAGYPSLFLLGTYFGSNDDPFRQLCKHCDAKCSVDEFLCALNTKAQINHQRIIIFIDAANEGNGKIIWKRYINSFICRLKKYEWLGLAISVRTTYADYMFPCDEITSDQMTRCSHYGFAGVTYDAVKLFFGTYGIELINSPLLVPEFNNPLFLSLFCKGLSQSGHKRVPLGMNGISSVLNLYINSVNRQLSAPDKLDYDEDLNIVQKAIEALSIAKIKNRNIPLTIEEAHEIVNEITTKFGVKHGLFRNLLDEHLISKDFGGIYTENIEITYERLQDYYSASFIVDNISDIRTAFVPNGEYYFLVEDSGINYQHIGIIEALSIILPERKGAEFYELVPDRNSHSVTMAFLDSLIWRNPNTLSDKLHDYINDVVLQYEYTANKFWDTVLQIAAIPRHQFNAMWLHRILTSCTMADRDAWWTIWLKDNYYKDGTIDKIVQWAYNCKNADDETVKLICIALVWFQTSTNRELRDCSTKALICLLCNRWNILLDILRLFESVNDPYVFERIYCAAYGVVLRSELTIIHYAELVDYIYHTIFDKDEIYPHILLRDYARNIIEYYIHIGGSVDFDMAKVRPPYKSALSLNGLSNDELDERYKPNADAPGFEKYHYAAMHILSSMTTEHGRGIANYGDFGRYVFQSALRHWDVDYDMLSNIAVEWIFEKYGYDVEKHGLFDQEIGYGRGRDTVPNERIGKKYQWIAFHELLARVSDNCRMLEEPWQKDSVIPYQGPWKPYVRDIDPSIIIKERVPKCADNKSTWLQKDKNIVSDMDDMDWAKNRTDLPDPIAQIELTDNNGECWLSLISHPEWKEEEKYEEDSSEPYKLIWQQIRSYLIKNEDYESFLLWAKEQDFTGRWMPEPNTVYELYDREYYWSPAYKDLCQPYEIKAIKDRTSHFDDKPIFCTKLTYAEFLWEAEEDHSKIEAISFNKPSKYLFEELNMQFSDKEGIWTDKNGEIICFNSSIWHGTQDCLLIKKASLLHFLKRNNLKIIWTVIGEKNIIRDLLRNDQYDPIEISGCYYLNEFDEIEGNYNIYSQKEKYLKEEQNTQNLDLNLEDIVHELAEEHLKIE